MTDKKILSRADVLSADDRVIEAIEVPEWGGSVLGRSLGMDELYDVRELAGLDEGGDIDAEKLNLLMFIQCVVDEDGEALFTQDDYEALRKKSAGAMLRVLSKINKLSGITDDTSEEARKN